MLYLSLRFYFLNIQIYLFYYLFYYLKYQGKNLKVEQLEIEKMFPISNKQAYTCSFCMSFIYTGLDYTAIERV